MNRDRTNTQKLMSLHVDGELYAATEQARGRVSRSQWIRDAILEKLARERIPVSPDAALPPDRAKKGGARWKPETVRKTPPSPLLNDAGDTDKPLTPPVPTKYPKGKKR